MAASGAVSDVIQKREIHIVRVITLIAGLGKAKVVITEITFNLRRSL